MTDKPLKRPPTSGTRKGNGAGRGGPAKGAGIETWAGGPAKGSSRPAFEIGNNVAAKTEENLSRAEVNRQRAEELKDRIYALARQAEREETQLAASIAFLNRVEGTPVSRTELTGKDGAPVELSSIRRVVVDPLQRD